VQPLAAAHVCRAAAVYRRLPASLQICVQPPVARCVFRNQKAPCDRKVIGFLLLASSPANDFVWGISFTFQGALAQEGFPRVSRAEQRPLWSAGQGRVPEWLGAQIHTTGARGGYRSLLETSTFSITLLTGVPHRPPICVEMHAFGLYTDEGGAVGARETLSRQAQCEGA
jgi:hypothetical protein